MSPTSLPTELDLASAFPAPDMAHWMQLTEKVLKGVPFEKKLVTRTSEGIALQPIYGKEVTDGSPLADGTPGAYPYVRGTRASGYKAGAWQIAQALPYATAAEFNQAAQRDLSRGQDALVLTLDENGRRGVDAAGAAGQCGTSIPTSAELRVALEGLDLCRTPLHVEAGASAPALAAMLLDLPVPPASGSVCFDPVALLAVHGTLPMTLDRGWEVLAMQVRSLASSAPGLRSVGVDVSWVQNAGGNAVWELALMLASAAESFRALSDRGVPADLAARKALVRFSVGTDFFMEISKFRAARGLWAHLVRACGGGDESAKLLQFAATSVWQQTKLDPYVNLLRATSEAFSAVIGGVDGLRVDPFDASFGLPNEFSRRIARNIQLVLRDEAHLTEVVDPAGGSWTVEHLTAELARRGWAQFQEIEKAGGILAMLRDGSLRERLREQGDAQRKRLAQRQEVKVGTNMYAFPEEQLPDARLPDTAAVGSQAAEAVAACKAGRDENAAQAALTRLESADSLEAVLQALRAGATPGEIARGLGGGEAYHANAVLLGRLTDGYEVLRANMRAHIEANGAAPRILLAQMGPVKQHKLRADFTLEFLKPAGFEVLADRSFADAQAAAEAVAASGAAATVICSTDETYPELVPAFARAVKAASPRTTVLVAGLLPEHVDAFKEAGVDEFIHVRANNLQLLTDLQALTGVAP